MIIRHNITVVLSSYFQIITIVSIIVVLGVKQSSGVPTKTFVELVAIEIDYKRCKGF